MRHLLAFLILIGLFVALIVITRPDPATDAALAINRTATGGAPTLEDILRRQNGEEVDNDGDADHDHECDYDSDGAATRTTTATYDDDSLSDSDSISDSD